MKSGLLVPGILMVLGTAAATGTFVLRADWLTAFSTLVVGYGALLFAESMK